MKKNVCILLLALVFVLDSNGQLTQTVTTANGMLLLKQVKDPILTSFGIDKSNSIDTIFVDEQQQFQKIEGFGYTLTGGSAQLLHQLSKQKRAALLKEIFGQGPNDLHVNYLRISMGASDLDASVFSYDDLPIGTEDPSLAKMYLSKDQQHLIPILKEIKQLQSQLKLIATPWSPPVWMKDNGKSMGGHLLSKYYAVYANYFVKYIQLMRKEGLNINAVTIQNEPEHGGNNPSMLMTAAEQKTFIKNHLGPAFKRQKLKTEIVIWDHNADHPNYPIEILNDSIAKSYISASAFHLYLGEASALSKLHQAHPDKKIYFTEQWTGAKGNFAGDFIWHMEHIVIGTMANWSSMVLEWNLANDPLYGPHTPGGCTECLGALTIDGEAIQRNVSYYIIAQAAKFIPRGSVRIQTTIQDASIKAIAFRKDQAKTMLVLNKAKSKKICIQDGEKTWIVELPENSNSVFSW